MSNPAGGSADNAFDRHLIHYGFEFYPSLIESAEGAVVRDVDGREILDFTSGQMCATLGHNHPAVVAAVERACRSVLHLYSGMIAVPVVRLAEVLAEMLPAGLQRMMFLSTGGEANEAALRMAKLHSGRFEVVGLTGSWHGMTAGAASSTYAAGHRGYGPALPGTMAIPAPNCYRCPVRHCRDSCDLACLEIGFAMVDAQSVGAPAAVLAEPVLSSAGVVVPPPGYFKRLKELCRARGMLLILDESQTALGRLGANFAFEIYETEPDILTISKTLGCGLPIAATITGDAIEADCRDKGFLHVTSHLSDPLVAEVGLAVLEALAAERINERALEMGAYLRAGLEELQSRHEVIGEVRGIGLLLGVDLVKDRETREPYPEMGRAVTRRALELGLSMNIVSVGGLAAVWRIAPPPIITREQVDRGIEILDRALGECRDQAVRGDF
jgi:2,2-dialkylglycine decarboxylase (pyruvate)